MDYEKKYKEMKARVLEMGRGYVKGLDYSKPRQIAEYIDPELKESEDEKIRKDIISYIQLANQFIPQFQKDKWIAWLEKQGNNINCIYDKELSELLHIVICRYVNDPDISYIERENVSKKIFPYVELLEKQGEHANFLSKIQIGDKVTRNEDGVLVNLSQLKRVAKPAEKQSKIAPTEDELEALRMAAYEPTKNWSEKLQSLYEKLTHCEQGEQKPLKEHDICNTCDEKASCVIPCPTKLVEQKPADKIEPKFKVGDWITDGNITIQIEAIKNDCYLYCGDCVLYSTKTADKIYHLWTIQDAKDGDVLASEDKDKVFIYNGKLDLRGRVCAYCGIYKTYDGLRFTECAIGNYFTYKEPHPATKEQRDQLEKAMADAGYIWDSKSKRLLSLKAGLNYTQNPAWSEEDEKMFNKIAAHLSATCNGFPEDEKWANEFLNWFKILKECVQFQSKQEWTKEDKDRYISCLQRLNTGNPEQPETINSKWFKEHVYPQKQWNPTEEQMKALHELNLIGSISYAGQGQILIELYNDLKKLTK